jgi:hypothetical protein
MLTCARAEQGRGAAYARPPGPNHSSCGGLELEQPIDRDHVPAEVESTPEDDLARPYCSRRTTLQRGRAELRHPGQLIIEREQGVD